MLPFHSLLVKVYTQQLTGLEIRRFNMQFIRKDNYQ